ncbi:MAG TPA: universal stress protein, partial [Myxococcota bacterium]|nr:universal stress protein [Myxococcota bacterium]
MILCGTDFSPAAREAARVAAALALASNEPLHLLHVLPEDAGQEDRVAAQAELSREVADLQRLGAVVSSAMARGFADELLREAAAQEGVRGVVVSSRGRRGLERLGLGSVA